MKVVRLERPDGYLYWNGASWGPRLKLAKRLPDVRADELREAINSLLEVTPLWDEGFVCGTIEVRR